MSTAKGAEPKGRALIVDDDPGVREFLETMLRKRRIQCQVARDGREAEYWLRTSRFDLVLLDLRLPVLSGEMIIEMIRAGQLPKPGRVVVTSASAVGTPPDGFEFLPKPFGPEEINPVLDKSFGPSATIPSVSDSKTVMLVGSGLWSDSLGRVILRNGGTVARAATAAEALPLAIESRARVVIVGPPVEGLDALSVSVDLLRDTAAAVLVGQSKTDAVTCASLLQVGVAAVILVPAGLQELATEVFRRMGLVRRGHPRAPLKSMVMVELDDGTASEGAAVDLSEGGMGVRGISRELQYAKTYRASFSLPGDNVRIKVGAELAWSIATGDSKWNVGLRFSSVNPRDQERLRTYMRSAIGPGDDDLL